MIKTSLKKILVLTLIICSLLIQTAFADNEVVPDTSQNSTLTQTVNDNSLEYLQSVMRMIKEKYKGEITSEKLMDGALKGMIDKVNEFVKKLTEDESQRLINLVSNTYEGIGVLIETSGDYVVVKKVFTASPAEAAGVLVGDKFAEVEGVSVVGAFTEELSSKVKGPVGTKVKILFLRGSEKIELEVSRGKISINPVTYETKGDIGYLQSAITMIKQQYNGAITDKNLMDGALKGIFDTMDAYTKYYNVEEASNFFNTLNGTYEGIGIVTEKEENYNVILKVYATSPAETAGIMPGDKIEKVEGVSVVGVSSEEFVSKVRGPAGTKIKLSVIRGTSQKLDIEVVRGKIEIAPVSFEIKGDIGYIKLDSFSEDSNSYMLKAIAEIDNKKIKKVILDLRNNGGGYVDQAVFIAQNFVPMGLITKLDYKSEKEKDVEYFSYLNNIKYKLAVLVNGNSASASEILAGAIQDRASGTIIGTKTYGKAKVQEIVPLLTPQVFDKLSKILGTNIADASSLYSYGIKLKANEIGGYTKITVGTYTTPKGRMIDLKGLTPDIVLENPIDTNKIDIRDIQKLSLKNALKIGQEGIDIYNAEKILSLSAFNIDVPDIKFDDKTSKELKVFQKDNKLTINGQLDLKTQQMLNNQLEKLILTIDKQYSEAIEVLNKN